MGICCSVSALHPQKTLLEQRQVVYIRIDIGPGHMTPAEISQVVFLLGLISKIIVSGTLSRRNEKGALYGEAIINHLAQTERGKECEDSDFIKDYVLCHYTAAGVTFSVKDSDSDVLPVSAADKIKKQVQGVRSIHCIQGIRLVGRNNISILSADYTGNIDEWMGVGLDKKDGNKNDFI